MQLKDVKKAISDAKAQSKKPVNLSKNLERECKASGLKISSEDLKLFTVSSFISKFMLSQENPLDLLKAIISNWTTITQVIFWLYSVKPPAEIAFHTPYFLKYKEVFIDSAKIINRKTYSDVSPALVYCELGEQYGGL